MSSAERSPGDAGRGPLARGGFDEQSFLPHLAQRLAWSGVTGAASTPTAYYLFATAAAGAGPLLLAPIQSHALGLAGYGQVVAFTTFAAIIATLVGLGLPQAAVSLANVSAPTELSSVLLRAWNPMAITGSFMALAAVFLTIGLPSRTPTLVLTLPSVMIGFGLARARLHLETMRALDAAQKYAITAGMVLIGLPGVATLSALYSPHVETYLWVWALGLIAADTVMTYAPGRARQRRIGGAMPGNLTLLSRRGLPLAGHSLVGAAVMFSDRMAILTFEGAEAVAAYQLAYLSGMAVLQVSNGLNVGHLPRYVRTRGASARARLGATMLFNLVAIHGFLAVALILLLGPALQIAGFPGSVRATVTGAAYLFAAAAAVQPYYIVGSNRMFADGRTGQLALWTAGANSAQAGMTWLLVPALGIHGAVVAVIVSQWIQAAAVYRPRRGGKLGAARSGFPAGIFVMTIALLGVAVTSAVLGERTSVYSVGAASGGGIALMALIIKKWKPYAV